MCDDIRIIGLAETIADLSDAELDDLAEDLVLHYRGHAMDLEERIGKYRELRIENLVRAVANNS
jgi:hypothetical protein